MSVYSQNFIADTFVVGIHKAVGVTRGILAIIITEPAAIVSPAKFWDTFEKRIQTKLIKVPDEEKDITVDVLLIKCLGNISVEAILEKIGNRYSEIRMYDIKDVKIKEL